MPSTENSDGQGRICPQCYYQRAAVEFAPDWQCPSCQIVYDKYVSKHEFDSPELRPEQQITNRAENSAKNQSSPLPWLILLFCGLLLGGYACYNYFRWPDTDKITLFTSADCGTNCRAASNWLEAAEVPYVEKDIDANRENHSRWKRAGGNNVPLVFFGEERIEGFNNTVYQIALSGFQDRMNNQINQTIILFSSANCPDCETVATFLNEKKIKFEEYDIREPENYNVYQELFGHEIPLIFIGNIRLDGYSKVTLNLALDQVNLP